MQLPRELAGAVAGERAGEGLPSSGPDHGDPKRPGMGCRVRNGLVRIVQGKLGDLELAEVQQPCPDQRDHPKNSAGSEHPLAAVLTQFRMIQG